MAKFRTIPSDQNQGRHQSGSAGSRSIHKRMLAVRCFPPKQTLLNRPHSSLNEMALSERGSLIQISGGGRW
jgi:hypothetical protein